MRKIVEIFVVDASPEADWRWRETEDSLATS